MHIGSLTVTLSIPGALSLKTSGTLCEDCSTTIRGKFNVSAAEVGELNLWQTATIAVVIVANESASSTRCVEGNRDD